MEIKGALFDMDGTLIDSMPYWVLVPAEYMKKKGVILPDDIMDTLRACTITEGSAYLKNEFGLKETTEQVLSEIKKEIGYYYKNMVPLKPGVKELLTAMKKNGIRMGVLTASDGNLAKAALKNNGINSYFEFIMDCTEAGCNKNTPESFTRALEILGTDKDKTVVFEDSLHAILASRKAGLFTVGVYDAAADNDRREIIESSDLYVPSLEDLSIENYRLKTR